MTNLQSSDSVREFAEDLAAMLKRAELPSIHSGYWNMTVLQDPDSVKEFTEELAVMVKRAELIMQKCGLDECGRVIWNELPADSRPSNVREFKSLRRFQSYRMVRSRFFTAKHKALAYRVWKPLWLGFHFWRR